MNINRHNYEEYFILYADNELNSDNRRLVEDFVAANPDLKDELDNFLNTILHPDTNMGFDNKEELHRYDESLVSYIDDELNPDEKAALEKLIAASPVLQKDLVIYQKTKLEPDTSIVFENKSALYRRTEKKRVVPITFIRWSAAAAVLLALSVTAVNLFNKEPKQPDTARLNEGKTNTPQILTPGDKTDLVKGETNFEKQTTAENDALSPELNPDQKQKNLGQADTKRKTIAVEKKNDPVLVPQEKKQDIAIQQQPPSNNLPIPQITPGNIGNNQKPNDAIAVNVPQITEPAVTNPDAKPYNNQKQAAGDAKAEPVFASLTDMEEDGGQNKKSRGLFRKLTRVFEKNTGIKATTDDDKLHFAAFTVKLK